MEALLPRFLRDSVGPTVFGAYTIYVPKTVPTIVAKKYFSGKRSGKRSGN